jgi:hypothetical protein
MQIIVVFILTRFLYLFYFKDPNLYKNISVSDSLHLSIAFMFFYFICTSSTTISFCDNTKLPATALKHFWYKRDHVEFGKVKGTL